MRVAEALSRIDAIHDQLTKAEVYRGFRVSGVAAAGVVGLLAAAGQSWVIDSADATAFVGYWVAVAAVCGLLAGGAALHAHWFPEDAFARRRSRRLLAQLLPSLVGGAVVTGALLNAGPAQVAFLPGLWAVVFAQGVFAARPYLPRAAGWVGLFYLACGAGLLARASAGGQPVGWDVGGVFGVGHLLTAGVLYRNVERHDHARAIDG